MIWYESAEEDFRREKGDIESNEKTRNYDIETTKGKPPFGLNRKRPGELRRCLFLSQCNR